MGNYNVSNITKEDCLRTYNEHMNSHNQGYFKTMQKFASTMMPLVGGSSPFSKESWDKIHATLTMEYNPLSASQYNETEITDDEGENTDNSTEVKQNDVSTSDSLPDNFISDGKSTNDSQASSTSKSSTKRTLTRTSNSTSYKPVDLLKSEIEMRIENKFTSRVLEDVKNYIAMPIY